MPRTRSLGIGPVGAFMPGEDVMEPAPLVSREMLQAFGPSLLSRMREADAAQQQRWQAGERSPTPMTEDRAWLADDVAGSLLGPMGIMALGVKAPAKFDGLIKHYQKYYGQRTWPDIDAAKSDIRRAIERENERYGGLFGATDPTVVDHLEFVKASGNGVKITQKGSAAAKRPALSFSDEPIGNAPDVAWRRADLIHGGTPESAMKEYGRGKGTVHSGYVPMEALPKESLSGGRAAYDWRELERGGAPPAVTIRFNKNGTASILDGNHRIAYWRDQGFDSVPAFIIDERGAK